MESSPAHSPGCDEEDAMKKTLFALVVCLVLLATAAGPVSADGIIIPPPCRGLDCPQPPQRPITQLNIRYHHVDVRIDNQIAVTRVDQIFHNPNSYPVEGTYVFPLPLDAVVNSFTLWVDGQPVEGKVLPAEEARQVYEDIVRDLKDPALLEYVGRGAVQASVFPIPPDGERRIQLEYSQVLTAENGLVRYTYPLNTEKFSVEPLESVTIRVEVRAGQPLRAVYSPSHSVDVQRPDEQQAVVTFEQNDVRPDQDFDLMYSLGESEAFHLFSYRDPGDPADRDGFFLLLLAPRPGAQSQTVAKDLLLVLDHSGSMEGEKFQQAQAALRYILGHLNPEDRFHITAFSTGVEVYNTELLPASRADDALRWVNSLSAVGSTDINRALLEAAAVADSERPTYLIFLTDGLPTEGVVDTPEITRNFAQGAPGNLRLFAFGVGYDVDTALLDTLSQEHHGQSAYVRPDEKLDEILSAFYQRISAPVLTGLQIDFGSIAAFDVYPNPLPDLFSGSQVIVAGRYHEGGVADITLSGEVNGAKQEIRFPRQVFTTDSRGAFTGQEGTVPRLWATRKVGYLLNKIRLEGAGKETIAQIVKLSIRYGIVTPYTSYLVDEPMPLGAQGQEQIISEAYSQSLEVPLETSGKAAVDRAAQEGQMQAAEVAPAIPSIQAGQGPAGEGNALVRVVGARTFILQEGTWIDTAYDPQAGPAQRVPFLSEAYFTLVDTRPDLAPALSLGEQLIVVAGDQAYQVVPEGEDTGAVAIPSPLPTQATARTATAVPAVPGSPAGPAKSTPAPGGAPAGSRIPAAAPWAALALLLLLVLGVLLKKDAA